MPVAETQHNIHIYYINMQYHGAKYANDYDSIIYNIRIMTNDAISFREIQMKAIMKEIFVEYRKIPGNAG